MRFKWMFLTNGGENVSLENAMINEDMDNTLDNDSLSY
jgi:hypothetical protein